MAGIFSNKMKGIMNAQKKKTQSKFWRNIFRLAGVLLSAISLMTALPCDVNAASNRLSTSAPVGQGFWPAVGYGVGTMRFEHLGAAEGLSENAVTTIFQDRQGFMWFGTREGLNKYNGYGFTVYKADPNDPAALSDGYITAALQTQNSDIWLGTYYGGLNRFDPDQNQFEHFLSGARVSALLEDSSGRLWVGSQDGLYVFDSQDEHFSLFQADPNEPDSLGDTPVQTLFEDAQGRLWVGTASGLAQIDAKKGTFERFLQDDYSDNCDVRSIIGDGNDSLWIGTAGGLVHFFPESAAFQRYQHDPDQQDSLSGNIVNVVFRDQSGHLWLGLEEDGVNLVTEVDQDQLHVIQYAQQDYDSQSLSHDAVRAIYQDRGGVMWFGTFGGGINKADPDTRAFGHYQHSPENPNSPAGEQITALVYDDIRESLWVGTAEDGLDRLDLASGVFEHFGQHAGGENVLDNDHILALHMDGRGVLWVAVQDGLLYYLEPQTQQFVHFPINLAAEGISGEITTINHDQDDHIWVGFESGALLRILSSYEEIVWYYLRSEEDWALNSNMILSLMPGANGEVWLGTENQGLVRFYPEDESFDRFFEDGSIGGPSHNSINNIYQDHQGILWLGTSGGGLNRFDPDTETFTHFTIQDGLPSNRIFGILPDEFGYLWLSTANGLSRFNPITEVVRNYDERDGLQGNTFNLHAYAASEDGALFFGGVNGFNAFYPRLINDNDYVPPIVITSVALFNQTVRTDIAHCNQSLELAYDQNFLSFEFAALDYTAPGKNLYAYKLEGINEDFVDVGNRRHADYPNLPWGEYTFRLIGSNNDQVWNTTGACLVIKIQPPFWATWWFIGLVGIFLAGSVVLGYRLRLRTIENQRQRLAVQVFRRTQEIERRRQIAAGLSEVVRLLNTNQPLEESLDFIVKQAIGLTSASKAAIFERQGDLIVVKACYPEEETRTLSLDDPDSSSGQALLDSIFIKRYLIYSRVNPQTLQSDTNWELVDGDYRTVICMPLIVEDVVYGGLVMYYGEERTFTPDEINLAHTLADQASLAIANERLKATVKDVAIAAERNRLARELHDAVTQTLFSTSLIAEVLPKIWQKNPAEAAKRLNELRQLARGALAEMRTLLMELRPSALREADPVELFKHLTDAFTGRTGIPVNFEIDPKEDSDIPIEVKNVFYRIAQEGLNNIFKHAQAAQVWFKFYSDAEKVVLTITDDGVGFDTSGTRPGHLGLGIMLERAETIDADLKIVSQPDEGTTLHLVWSPNHNGLKS